MAKQTPAAVVSPINRSERILAYMIAAIVGLSILCFLAVIIATASKLPGNEFQGGIWQAVALLPGVGLPIAFVMVIVLLVISTRRRAREAREATTKSK